MGSFPLFQTRPEFILNKIGTMIIVEAFHASACACIHHLLGLHLSPLCKFWKGMRFIVVPIAQTWPYSLSEEAQHFASTGRLLSGMIDHLDTTILYSCPGNFREPSCDGNR